MEHISETWSIADTYLLNQNIGHNMYLRPGYESKRLVTYLRLVLRYKVTHTFYPTQNQKYNIYVELG